MGGQMSADGQSMEIGYGRNSVAKQLMGLSSYGDKLDGERIGTRDRERYGDIAYRAKITKTASGLSIDSGYGRGSTSDDRAYHDAVYRMEKGLAKIRDTFIKK